MLMFQINRVQYDQVEQKIFKDYSKFDFDKTIFIDLFLNKNRERAEKNRLELQQMKADLKVLKTQRSQYIDPMDRSIVDTLQETENIVKNEGEVSSEEMATTLKVLSMLKEKAQKNSSELE